MPHQILVIGAGAIGSLVAGQLAQAGYRVTLVGRPNAVEAIRSAGLHLVYPDHTATVHQMRPVASLAAAFDGQPDFQIAILAVKSYDTASAIAELTAATHAAPPVLSLQNGVGNEEVLASVLGADRVIAGAITTPASVAVPGAVVIERSAMRIGVADLTLGESRPTGAAEVAALLRRAGFRVQVVDGWKDLKWTKLLMNLLCNASCALLGWPPQRVWADPSLARLEINGWREAMVVMRRMGYRPLNFGSYPLNWLEPLLHRLPVDLLRAPLGRFIVAGRGGKMPSLYLDLSRGKGQSEVAWLNGAVVEASARTGAAAPVNRILFQSLSAVVDGREPWESYRDRPDRLLEQWELAKIYPG